MAGITDALSPISLGLGAAQTALGLYQQISGNAKMKKLLAQRKAYQTPDEIFKLLNATENMAQQGYDPTTLNYLTNQIDRAADSSLGAATRLGADPNDLSGILDQRIQGLMKVGVGNAQQHTENMKMYYSALETVASNNAAEQKSEQDILKDKIQAAGGQAQAGAANISGGINNVVSTLSADKISKLFEKMNKKPNGLTTGINAGSNLLTNFSPMGVNTETKSTPIDDDAYKQASGLYKLDRMTGQWVLK